MKLAGLVFAGRFDILGIDMPKLLSSALMVR